jgi:hypothetical protein
VASRDDRCACVCNGLYDDLTQTGYAIGTGEGRNRQRKSAEALNFESKQWVLIP